MRSYLNWLERNVHWLAMGLGILFFCAVVNVYLRHGLLIQLGSEQVPPGRVDSAIANGPVAELKRAMDRTDNVSAPNLNWKDDWRARLDTPGSRPEPSRSDGPANLPPPPAPILARSLSNPPAARPIGVSLFRGVVRAPEENWQPPAGQLDAAPPLIEVGRDIISFRFRVEGADISRWAHASFKGMSIPREIASTQVLAVIVTREHQQPDGSWKSAGTVHPLGIHTLKAYPGDRAPAAAGFEFRKWASANTEAIERPAFYEIVDGVAPVVPVAAIAPAVQRRLPVDARKLPEPRGGSIDLNKLPDFFELGVHDEQVLPGQTYRYRLQYKLYNPLYQTTALGTPDVSNTFAVESMPSDATAAATVPPREQFFVKALQNGHARFDLFVLDRQNKPVRQEVVAGPGDAIDGTGWTVVDIRERAGREPYVMLTDSLGRVVRRMRSLDQADSTYKNLRDRI